MSNYNEDNHTEQNKDNLFSNENTQSMLDFDYSSSLNKDYSKGLEQTIFVDEANPDPAENPGQTDLQASTWKSSSIGSISDYLNIDKPLDPSVPEPGLSGQVSWETDNTKAENNSTAQDNQPPSPDEDGYRQWTAPQNGTGHRQGSLNPLYRQGSLDPSEPPTPPTPPTPSQQSGGMSGQETGKRPAGKGKKPVLLWVIAAVLAAAVLVTVLNSESRTQYHIGGEQASQTESENTLAEQTESEDTLAETSEDPEDDFWNRKGNHLISGGYADFYTPKCLTTESMYFGEEYEYIEACVVDPKSLIGTASDPVLQENDFNSFLSETKYDISYLSSSSFLSFGFSFAYASPKNEYDDSYDSTNMEYMHLPDYADQDLFFERVRASYEKEASQSALDIFKDLKSSDLKSADVSGHKVSYMESTYKGYDGKEVFDVIAFEERPKGYAFVSEYRCPKSELSKGVDALTRLYGMLSFYTEEKFPDIDAAIGFWPETRIYNPDNSRSVLINVSDFIESGTTFQDEKGEVSIYGGDYENEEVHVGVRYDNFYKYLNDKSFDDHIKETLKNLEDFDYKDCKEHGRKEFEYSGCEVSYFSYDYVRDYSEPENFRVHEWLIETPEGEEISIELTYGITVPDDPDPEEFLKQHITLEK